MGTIVLNKVRLSFPDLFKVGTPPAGSTSEPKFGASSFLQKTVRLTPVPKPK